MSTVEKAIHAPSLLLSTYKQIKALIALLVFKLVSIWLSCLKLPPACIPHGHMHKTHANIFVRNNCKNAKFTYRDHVQLSGKTTVTALDQHKPAHTQLYHSFEAHNPLQHRLLIHGSTSISCASQVFYSKTHTHTKCPSVIVCLCWDRALGGAQVMRGKEVDESKPPQEITSFLSALYSFCVTPFPPVQLQM